MPKFPTQTMLATATFAAILLVVHYAVSATQLRNQIHGNGQPSLQPSILDPPVLQYIHQHHLYA